MGQVYHQFSNLFVNCYFNLKSRLLDTLLSAEKHGHDSTFPFNPYRKLLVCELLPLLAHKNAKIDLSSKVLLKLLYKSVEFYSCYLGIPSGTGITQVPIILYYE